MIVSLSKENIKWYNKTIGTGHFEFKLGEDPFELLDILSDGCFCHLKFINYFIDDLYQDLPRLLNYFDRHICLYCTNSIFSCLKLSHPIIYDILIYAKHKFCGIAHFWDETAFQLCAMLKEWPEAQDEILKNPKCIDILDLLASCYTPGIELKNLKQRKLDLLNKQQVS